MAGRQQSESTSMKLIKPADMKSFILESRQNSMTIHFPFILDFSKEELDSFNKGLLSLADTINTSITTIKSTDNHSSFSNSLNVTTLFRGSAGSGRNGKSSVSSIQTTNGGIQFISLFPS